MNLFLASLVDLALRSYLFKGVAVGVQVYVIGHLIGLYSFVEGYLRHLMA